MAVSAGMLEKNLPNASSPPAEAPIPTTGKLWFRICFSLRFLFFDAVSVVFDFFILPPHRRSPLSCGLNGFSMMSIF